MKVHVVGSRRHSRDLVMAAVVSHLDTSRHKRVRSPNDAEAVVIVDVGSGVFDLDPRNRDLPTIAVEVEKGRFVVEFRRYGGYANRLGRPGKQPSRLSVLTPEAAADAVVSLLDGLDPAKNSGPAVAAEHQLQMALESFVVLWEQASAHLGLSLDDRRNGDALAQAVGELAKSDHPPRDVLRAMFTWFAKKVDVFTDEAAKSAGKAYGTAAGAAAGAATVTAVAAAAARVLGLLGGN